MNSIQSSFRAMVLFIMVGTVSTTYGWQGWTAWFGNGFDAAKKSLVSQKKEVTKTTSSAATYGYSIIGSVNRSGKYVIHNIKKTVKSHPYGTYLMVGVVLGICIALRWNRKKRTA